MSKIHRVKAGDHIPKIVAANQFREVATVWDHPNNAKLKEKRQPCILNPGDEVFVPDKNRKTVEARTGVTHKFVVKQFELRLRVVLKNASRRPIAGAACKLECKGAPTSTVTDGTGKFDEPIAVDAEIGKLAFANSQIQLLIGHLAPIDELAGQRGRLNNLGYYAGIDDRSDPEEPEPEVVLRSAIEEFQCDHPPLKITGTLDAATKAKLVAETRC